MRVPPWAPEVEVGRDLAGRLIGEQFPQLAEAPIRFLSAGFDNTVFAVDGRWAFRFPRRAVAVPGVERELAMLPAIAARLGPVVPTPTHIGRPTDAFAWPWFGARLLPGREPTTALDDAARAILAPRLGRLLRTLHRAPAPRNLPHDPMGRVDMARRVPFAAEQLAEVAAEGLRDLRDAAAPILAAASELAPSARRALVHGDLHFRHLLVGRAGELTGVIDWGDICVGDPAMDLQIAWSLISPGARPDFWQAYGPIEPDQALRARVVALYLGAVLARYGQAQELAGVRDEALAALERTLVD